MIRIGEPRTIWSALWKWLFPTPPPIEYCSRCHNITKESAHRMKCCRSYDCCHGRSVYLGADGTQREICCILHHSWS